MNAERDMPLNWVRGKLGEILPIEYGKALRAADRSENGTIPVYGSNGVVGYHSNALTRGPTIVVGRKGAAGSVHYSADPCWVIDTAYFSEADAVLDLKFASFLLRSLQLGALDRSTAIPSLSRDDYGAVEAPTPPRIEQLRIVSKIEELFSDLDAGVAALERARANLKRYRAAVLKAAVEGRLTEQWRKAHPDVEPASKLLEHILAARRRKWEETQLAKFAAADKAPPKGWKDKYPEPAEPDTTILSELPEGWCWATVEQLIHRSEYGTSVRCDYEGKFSPVLRIPNIANGSVDLSDLKFSITDLDLEPADELLPGDLLMCRTNGSISLVGKSALVRGQLDRPYAFASYLLRFRFLDSGSAPAWVLVFVTSQKGRAFIESKAASSAGQHNISLSTLHGMPVPLPPVEEQKQITTLIDERFSVIEKASADLDIEIERSSRLRQSILKRAFEGKLVPQDPNEEPASVLFERIRAARAGQTPPRAQKRRKAPA